MSPPTPSAPSPLLTPIYLKTDEEMPWPEKQSVFYRLTSDGLFICRNHQFFRSCVPTDTWPTELASQRTFCQIAYPKLSRRLLERVIGFFDKVGNDLSSEAAALLVWDGPARQVDVIVPDQVGIVSIGWCGQRYPLELEYDIPSLPPHLCLIGDIHSHVDGPAYASYTDKSDEAYRPGIHIVVGRLRDEPPQFHCEVVTDGVRFRTDLHSVTAGYHRRRLNDVPKAWLDRVKTRTWGSHKQSIESDSQRLPCRKDNPAQKETNPIPLAIGQDGQVSQTSRHPTTPHDSSHEPASRLA